MAKKHAGRVKKPAAAVVSSLTKAELRELRGAALRTWDVIGYDCLRALAEEEKCDINRVFIHRDEVIELVLDQIDMYGGKLSQRVKTWLAAAPYADIVAEVKSAFQHSRYGT